MFYKLHDVIRDRYFREFSHEPAPIREALIFRKTVETIPLQIRDTDRLAGWCGYEDCPPEMSDLTIRVEELPYRSFFSEEEAAVRATLDRDFLLFGGFGSGHTCIDYRRVIENGLESYVKIVEDELQGCVTEEKAVCLRAMLISLSAVGVYAARFAALAGERERSAESTEAAARYGNMRFALEKVPLHPAEGFFEALQAVWILHSLIPMAENDWASISLGRLDQYLLPFYRRSLENGYTREAAGRDLENLFLLLDSYGDGACALNIGGLDEEGRDQMNELSELLVQVEKTMRLRAPIFAARISERTPDSILDELIDEKLFTIGQPTFYGEEACRRAVRERGIGEGEAAGFSVNSCMGLVIAGAEIADMWGWMFNAHLPLELAVNHGKPLHGQLPFPLKTEAAVIVRDKEHLFSLYDSYCRELMAVCLRLNRKTSLECAANRPDPLLSALTEGCVEQGLDRALGAKYQNVTVETMGLVNTGNAITAIDTLVFQQKKYSLEELIVAVQRDFMGYEAIRRDIGACDKYGTNCPDADENCARLMRIAADVCRSFDFGNTRYLPSLHTLDANVEYGRRLYATLDGRLRGEPVNKNAGPTNDVRTGEPTSLAFSAATLEQHLFSGGQPIDLYFDKSSFTEEKKTKIRALIRTYFRLGGMQLQVNSIDSATLERADHEPDSYRELVVRIGGYSVRFCDMSALSRRELIERVRREEEK